VVFGTLSDKIGRKPIIMAACAGVLTYFPLFKALTEAANPDLAKAQATAQVSVKADPRPARSRAARSPVRSTSPPLRHRQACPGRRTRPATTT
jgi:hypothetical protein